MEFEKINKIILFAGGGKKLSLLLPKLKLKNIDFFVVTSQRQIHAVIDKQMTMEMYFKENDINFMVVDDINTDQIFNEISMSTLGISIGAAWIFKREFIDRFNGRMFNVHGARLPQNRGGGGFSWRILRKDVIGACLIHQVDEGIDTGEIIKYEEYIFPPTCRKPIDYYEYSVKKEIDFIEGFVCGVLAGKTFQTIPQQETFSIYFPRLNTELQGFINWDWRVEDIEVFINAFDDPYMGASTYLNGKLVRLKSCYSTKIDGVFHPFQSGIIYRIYENRIFIAGKGGALIIEEINDKGGNYILDDLQIGDRLYTPEKCLEKAKTTRIVYTSRGLEHNIIDPES